MTPNEAARKLAAIAQNLRAVKTKFAYKQSLRAIVAGRKWSKGTQTAASLRALGHPYAAHNPQPPADPGLINLRTGGLYNGWRTRVMDGGTRIVLFNVAPEAIFIDPKYHTAANKMMLRPITDRIAGDLNKTFVSDIRALVLEAWKP